MVRLLTDEGTRSVPMLTIEMTNLAERIRFVFVLIFLRWKIWLNGSKILNMQMCSYHHVLRYSLSSLRVSYSGVESYKRARPNIAKWVP